MPFFRRTIEDAGLEGAVVAIVGESATVGRFWSTPVGLLFIDGGHADDVAMADFGTWAGFVAAGGVLAIHDVFEDPTDGGQAPFRVWQRAVADGFEPVSATGSLRVLRRSGP
jgi:MMP 1-O-methyltransferase